MTWSLPWWHDWYTTFES